MAEASTLIARKSSELFYKNGFAGVPVEGIIEHSGVSRRTFYRYFHDKEDAICAALRYRAEQFCDAIWLAASRHDTLHHSVAAVFEALIGWHREHGYHGCLFQTAISEYGHSSPRICQVTRTHKLQFEELLARIFAEKGHAQPRSFAKVVTLLIEGAVALGSFGDAMAHIRRAQATAVTLLESKGG